MKFKTVKPFVKWAGGKSQLLGEIRKKYPDTIECYCEPFVAGGAVLLDVLANFQPKEVLINDVNAELTNAYVQVRDNVDKLVDRLSEMQNEFWMMNEDERKEYYYKQRERFNELIGNNDSLNEKAALFIFLNKTCFNGLYRVNSKGLYNVPMGAYKKPSICDEVSIRLISGLLKNVEIMLFNSNGGNYEIQNNNRRNDFRGFLS
ncbi:MAG: Dam family site-specific DNA-(adenine-N6)-methyltransferase [Ruminococcus sp.]|nr:Dam family site-specific DNA-(adenine-N6)-methyltransferase [Ruminococcus sp.]